MYKLICSNLSKSHKSLTSFTSPYKIVAQSYETYRWKKFVSETDLYRKQDAEDAEKTEQSCETAENEITTEAKTQSSSSFFNRKHRFFSPESVPRTSSFACCKKHIFSTESIPENVRCSATPPRYFHSSLMAHSSFTNASPKKKSFKDKQAAELYKTAVAQCMHIKSKFDRINRRFSWVPRQPKPEFWDDAPEPEVEVRQEPPSPKLVTPRKIIYAPMQTRSGNEYSVPEINEISRMRDRANYQFKSRNFKITYPTHSVKYKLAFSKPHDIKQTKSGDPKKQKEGNKQPYAQTFVSKYSQARDQPNLALIVKRNTENRRQFEEQQQLEELEEPPEEYQLIKQHPTVTKASATAKMAISSKYNKLLSKSQLQYQEKQPQIEEKLAEEEPPVAAKEETQPNNEAVYQLKESPTMTINMKELEEDLESVLKTLEAHANTHIVAHPISQTNPDLATKHPKDIMWEKDATFDIESTCIKTNENSTTHTKYGDYVAEIDQTGNIVETKNAEDLKPNVVEDKTVKVPEKTVGLEKEKTKAEIEDDKSEERAQTPVESLGEYLKKLRALKDQTAVDRSQLQKSEELKKPVLVQKVDTPKIKEIAKRIEDQVAKVLAREQKEEKAVEAPKKIEHIVQKQIKTIKPSFAAVAAKKPTLEAENTAELPKKIEPKKESFKLDPLVAKSKWPEPPRTKELPPIKIEPVKNLQIKRHKSEEPRKIDYPKMKDANLGGKSYADIYKNRPPTPDTPVRLKIRAKSEQPSAKPAPSQQSKIVRNRRSLLENFVPREPLDDKKCDWKREDYTKHYRRTEQKKSIENLRKIMKHYNVKNQEEVKVQRRTDPDAINEIAKQTAELKRVNKRKRRQEQGKLSPKPAEAEKPKPKVEEKKDLPQEDLPELSGNIKPEKIRSRYKLDMNLRLEPSIEDTLQLVAIQNRPRLSSIQLSASQDIAKTTKIEEKPARVTNKYRLDQVEIKPSIDDKDLKRDKYRLDQAQLPSITDEKPALQQSLPSKDPEEKEKEPDVIVSRLDQNMADIKASTELQVKLDESKTDDIQIAEEKDIATDTTDSQLEQILNEKIEKKPDKLEDKPETKAVSRGEQPKLEAKAEAASEKAKLETADKKPEAKLKPVRAQSYMEKVRAQQKAVDDSAIAAETSESKLAEILTEEKRVKLEKQKVKSLDSKVTQAKPEPTGEEKAKLDKKPEPVLQKLRPIRTQSYIEKIRMQQNYVKMKAAGLKITEPVKDKLEVDKPKNFGLDDRPMIRRDKPEPPPKGKVKKDKPKTKNDMILPSKGKNDPKTMLECSEVIKEISNQLIGKCEVAKVEKPGKSLAKLAEEQKDLILKQIDKKWEEANLSTERPEGAKGDQLEEESGTLGLLDLGMNKRKYAKEYGMPKSEDLKDNAENVTKDLQPKRKIFKGGKYQPKAASEIDDLTTDVADKAKAVKGEENQIEKVLKIAKEYGTPKSEDLKEAAEKTSGNVTMDLQPKRKIFKGGKYQPKAASKIDDLTTDVADKAKAVKGEENQIEKVLKTDNLTTKGEKTQLKSQFPEGIVEEKPAENLSLLEDIGTFELTKLGREAKLEKVGILEKFEKLETYERPFSTDSCFSKIRRVKFEDDPGYEMHAKQPEEKLEADSASTEQPALDKESVAQQGIKTSPYSTDSCFVSREKVKIDEDMQAAKGSTLISEKSKEAPKKPTKKHIKKREPTMGVPKTFPETPAEAATKPSAEAQGEETFLPNFKKKHVKKSRKRKETPVKVTAALKNTKPVAKKNEDAKSNMEKFMTLDTPATNDKVKKSAQEQHQNEATGKKTALKDPQQEESSRKDTKKEDSVEVPGKKTKVILRLNRDPLMFMSAYKHTDKRSRESPKLDVAQDQRAGKTKYVKKATFSLSRFSLFDEILKNSAKNTKKENLFSLHMERERKYERQRELTNLMMPQKTNFEASTAYFSKQERKEKVYGAGKTRKQSPENALPIDISDLTKPLPKQKAYEDDVVPKRVAPRRSRTRICQKNVYLSKHDRKSNIYSTRGQKSSTDVPKSSAESSSRELQASKKQQGKNPAKKKVFPTRKISENASEIAPEPEPEPEPMHIRRNPILDWEKEDARYRPGPTSLERSIMERKKDLATQPKAALENVSATKEMKHVDSIRKTEPDKVTDVKKIQEASLEPLEILKNPILYWEKAESKHIEVAKSEQDKITEQKMAVIKKNQELQLPEEASATKKEPQLTETQREKVAEATKIAETMPEQLEILKNPILHWEKAESKRIEVAKSVQDKIVAATKKQQLQLPEEASATKKEPQLTETQPEKVTVAKKVTETRPEQLQTLKNPILHWEKSAKHVQIAKNVPNVEPKITFTSKNQLQLPEKVASATRKQAHVEPEKISTIKKVFATKKIHRTLPEIKATSSIETCPKPTPIERPLEPIRSSSEMIIKTSKIISDDSSTVQSRKTVYIPRKRDSVVTSNLKSVDGTHKQTDRLKAKPSVTETKQDTGKNITVPNSKLENTMGRQMDRSKTHLSEHNERILTLMELKMSKEIGKMLAQEKAICEAHIANKTEEKEHALAQEEQMVQKTEQKEKRGTESKEIVVQKGVIKGQTANKIEGKDVPKQNLLGPKMTALEEQRVNVIEEKSEPRKILPVGEKSGLEVKEKAIKYLLVQEKPTLEQTVKKIEEKPKQRQNLLVRETATLEEQTANKIKVNERAKKYLLVQEKPTVKEQTVKKIERKPKPRQNLLVQEKPQVDEQTTNQTQEALKEKLPIEENDTAKEQIVNDIEETSREKLLVDYKPALGEQTVHQTNKTSTKKLLVKEKATAQEQIVNNTEELSREKLLVHYKPTVVEKTVNETDKTSTKKPLVEDTAQEQIVNNTEEISREKLPVYYKSAPGEQTVNKIEDTSTEEVLVEAKDTVEEKIVDNIPETIEKLLVHYKSALGEQTVNNLEETSANKLLVEEKDTAQEQIVNNTEETSREKLLVHYKPTHYKLGGQTENKMEETSTEAVLVEEKDTVEEQIVNNVPETSLEKLLIQYKAATEEQTVNKIEDKPKEQLQVQEKVAEQKEITDQEAKTAQLLLLLQEQTAKALEEKRTTLKIEEDAPKPTFLLECSKERGDSKEHSRIKKKLEKVRKTYREKCLEDAQSESFYLAKKQQATSDVGAKLLNENDPFYKVIDESTAKEQFLLECAAAKEPKVIDKKIDKLRKNYLEKCLEDPRSDAFLLSKKEQASKDVENVKIKALEEAKKRPPPKLLQAPKQRPKTALAIIRSTYESEKPIKPRSRSSKTPEKRTKLAQSDKDAETKLFSKKHLTEKTFNLPDNNPKRLISSKHVDADKDGKSAFYHEKYLEKQKHLKDKEIRNNSPQTECAPDAQASPPKYLFDDQLYPTFITFLSQKNKTKPEFSKGTSKISEHNVPPNQNAEVQNKCSDSSLNDVSTKTPSNTTLYEFKAAISEVPVKNEPKITATSSSYNTNQPVIVAKIEKILKNDYKPDEKICKFNKNLMRHCKPLKEDEQQRSRQKTTQLAKEHKPGVKNVTYVIEKSVPNRYEQIKPKPANPVLHTCERICLPTKNIREVALKPSVDELTTLNKVMTGEKITGAPIAEPDNLEKYKHLKITHMRVRRNRKRQETFLPSILIVKTKDGEGGSTRADRPPNLKEIMDLRYELLKKLHKEFCALQEKETEEAKKKLVVTKPKNDKKECVKPAPIEKEPTARPTVFYKTVTQEDKIDVAQEKEVCNTNVGLHTHDDSKFADIIKKLGQKDTDGKKGAKNNALSEDKDKPDDNEK